MKDALGISLNIYVQRLSRKAKAAIRLTLLGGR